MNSENDPRDPALDALWRRASRESPPEHLDRAILAAAHRAVGSAPSAAPSATRPWQWWAPLAAAAAIGAIAIGVLQLSPSERDATTAVLSDATPTIPSDKLSSVAPVQEPSARKDAEPAPIVAPPPPAAAPQKSKPSPPPMRERKKAENAAQAPQPFPVERQEVARDNAAAPPAPAAPAAPPPSAAAEAPPQLAGAVKRDEREAASGYPAGSTDRATAARAQSAPALAKTATADEARLRRDATEWTARIRALREAGRNDEAARELTAFRAAYRDADARLPEDLRAWAASIKP